MPTSENSAVYKVLQQVGQEIVDEVRDAIEKDDLVASKGLLQGFDFGISVLGTGYLVRWDWSGNPKAEQYVKYVIEGRSGGKRPPIEAIMTWIKKKPIAVSLTKKRKQTLSSLKNKRVKKALKQISKEQATKSLAFAIATNISKKGTIKRFGYKGKDFLTPVKDDLVGRIKSRLTEAFKKDFIIELLQ